MPRAVGKQGKVGQRIAIDDNQVRALSRREAAELALASKEAGGIDGRAADHLDRRQHFVPDEKLFTLAIVQRAEQICADLC